MYFQFQSSFHLNSYLLIFGINIELPQNLLRLIVRIPEHNMYTINKVFTGPNKCHKWDYSCLQKRSYNNLFTWFNLRRLTTKNVQLNTKFYLH
jgi:hypothetical protein